MNYHYGPLTTVAQLEPGAIFETNEGIRAVVSEYHLEPKFEKRHCILLGSGEYAHFANGDAEPCRELILVERATEDEEDE